jgi:hypothetical protein
MRAIWWSRQKRYLPQPNGEMPKTALPISHGALRLASTAHSRQSSRGKTTYGSGDHPLTNEEFEADWAESEES